VFDVDFGEVRVSESLRVAFPDVLDVMELDDKNKFVLRQSPDMFVVVVDTNGEGETVLLIDVAVSSNPRIRAQGKIANYAELRESLRDYGVVAEVIPIVFSTDGANVDDWGGRLPVNSHGFIRSILERLNGFLSGFHSTELGKEFQGLFLEEEVRTLSPDCPLRSEDGELDVRPPDLFNEDHWKSKEVNDADEAFLVWLRGQSGNNVLTSSSRNKP
jgi:hypothetical protein